MPLSCPECGGVEIRELDAGLMRCTSMRKVGEQHVPPEVTGGGFHIHPIYGECGHVFQVGVTNLSCSLCGRAALGRCDDCQQPICHVHGTGSGAFLCARCVEARRAAVLAQRAREQQEAAARRAATDPGERIRAGDFTTAEAPDLFAAGFGALTMDEIDLAWERYVRLPGTPDPTHQLLDLQFAQRGLFGRNHILTLRRIGAWPAIRERVTFWVDAEGLLWRARPSGGTAARSGSFVVSHGAGPVLSVAVGRDPGGDFLANGQRVVPAKAPDHVTREVILEAVRRSAPAREPAS